MLTVVPVASAAPVDSETPVAPVLLPSVRCTAVGSVLTVPTVRWPLVTITRIARYTNKRILIVSMR